MTERKAFRSTDFFGAFMFLVLWGGSTLYLGLTGADWVFPIISLGVFGVGLSAVAWLTTRGASGPAVAVRRPTFEAIALLVFLAFYAAIFLGWGMSALRGLYPEGRERELVILTGKLVAHVILPSLILFALGARIGVLFRSKLPARIFWRTLITFGVIFTALLAVVSPSLKEIGEVDPPLETLLWAVPASFFWLSVEAGLNEEFLFRALLQTRLSALFNSVWAGVAVTSILFGLAHAPGLYLRGGPGIEGWSSDPLQVVAYTIATLSPLSLFFGFLYARTKSLLLVILLHASVDFLPNLSEFLRIWSP